MNEEQIVTEEIDRMLSVSDIAELMNYSMNTVRQLVKAGAFSRVHRADLGQGRKGHIRIYESDFLEWREKTTEDSYEE